jgi:hypothetical protein
VTPVQLDPELKPNASRRPSEELRLAGRTLRAVVRGSEGRARTETSPRQLRRLPLELSADLAANESALPPVDEGNVAGNVKTRLNRPPPVCCSCRVATGGVKAMVRKSRFNPFNSGFNSYFINQTQDR